jgi:hypothetical protein
MSVEFNEDYQGGVYQSGSANHSSTGGNFSGVNSNKQSKMVAWLMKIGIVKTESSANTLLLTITVMFFILSIVIMFKFVR